MADRARSSLLDFAIVASMAVLPVLLGVLLLVAALRPSDGGDAAASANRHVSVRQLAALKTFEPAVVRRAAATGAPSAEQLLAHLPACRREWGAQAGVDRPAAGRSSTARGRRPLARPCGWQNSSPRSTGRWPASAAATTAASSSRSACMPHAGSRPLPGRWRRRSRLPGIRSCASSSRCDDIAAAVRTHGACRRPTARKPGLAWYRGRTGSLPAGGPTSGWRCRRGSWRAPTHGAGWPAASTWGAAAAMPHPPGSPPAHAAPTSASAADLK